MISRIVVLFVIACMIVSVSPVFGAQATYSITDKQVSAKIDFEKKPDVLNSYIKNSKFILEIDGKISLSEEEFWGSPMTSVSTSYSEGITSVIFDFIDKPSAPRVEIKGNSIFVEFDLTASNNVAESSGNVYLRLFFGLGMILVMILIFYFFVKFFMKKNITSDIPGIGRLMGKVDIMPGRNLVFYELDESIYILGISGDSISLVDKISDEDQVSRIKSGFSKRKDFGSYLKFFNKESVDEEVKISSSLIKDKVDSLRKR